MENGISQRPNNQLLIQHIIDAVILTDENFGITAFNTAAEKLFGYKECEMLGGDIARLIPFDTTRPGPLSVKTPGFTQGIVEQLTSNNEIIYVHASLHAIKAANVPSAYLIIYKSVEANREQLAARSSLPGITLYKSEEKYRLLMEQALDGIFICDHNGFLVYVNTSGCTMSGYSREELLQMSFIDLIPHERRSAELETFYALRNGPIIHKDAQLLRKDGVIMYVELSAQYTADGFVTGICHDITQRKRTEIALQQSEERYRRLIEQASDGVLIFSKEYHCLDANTSACEMTGYARHELIGMNLLGLIDPQDLHANPPQVEKLRIGEKTITERKMRKKDGTIFYGESVVQIMPDGHIVSFLRNITQRKKSELARQRSEQTYRVLFQQSPLPMFVVNYQTLRIIAANDAAIHFYGYTKDDFLSLTAFDLRPPEDQAAYLEKMQHATEGVMKMGISRHIKKDGNVVEVEIYSHHFGYEGKHYRLVLALDVTEKQKAARELIDTTSQLRELSDHLQTIRENERTKISREIHDELGQQLTILKMDISWMHQKLKSYNNTELVERSEEALNMLNDTIKTVRRIATELRPSLLDDLGLAAALEWQSKEFESRSGIKITFTSNVTSLPIKNAVATSLFRIYQEALTNVARHAKASHVTCSLALTNEQLVLTIKDDGRGFDMQTTDNKKTLGLLGMKERTLMMGGYFNITSAAGEGTTITVKTSIN